MKLIKFLLFSLVFALASCGGGGGFSGDPNGPSATLRVFPPIEAVTVPVGYSYATVEIQGGRPPYVVTSSAPAVRASVVNGNFLQITGFSAGTSEIGVVDQERKIVKIQATATVVPIRTSIGNSVSISPSQSITFDVSGGVGPYLVRSADNRVVSVTPATESFGPFTITGIGVGAGVVTVVDRSGVEYAIDVAVQTTPITVNPSSGNGKAGTNISFAVAGGVAPFSVISSDSSVADGSLSAGVLTVALKRKGSATLVIRDAQGSVTPISISVDDSSLVVAPAVQEIVETFAGSVSYAISGGVAPFTTVVSNPGVATATISADNSRLILTAGSGGDFCVAADTSVLVSVYDQTGSFRDVRLNIKNAAVCP